MSDIEKKKYSGAKGNYNAYSNLEYVVPDSASGETSANAPRAGIAIQTWGQHTAEGYTGGAKLVLTTIVSREEILSGKMDREELRHRINQFYQDNPIDTGLFSPPEPRYLKTTNRRYSVYLEKLLDKGMDAMDGVRKHAEEVAAPAPAAIDPAETAHAKPMATPERTLPPAAVTPAIKATAATVVPQHAATVSDVEELLQTLKYNVEPKDGKIDAALLNSVNKFKMDYHLGKQGGIDQQTLNMVRDEAQKLLAQGATGDTGPRTVAMTGGGARARDGR